MDETGDGMGDLIHVNAGWEGVQTNGMKLITILDQFVKNSFLPVTARGKKFQ